MKNNFLKIASLAVITTLSYSTIDLNSLQATNNLSNFFLAAKTTKNQIIKIESNAVIDDVMKPNLKAINKGIAITKNLNKLPEKTNLESELIDAKSQTKFVKAKV